MRIERNYDDHEESGGFTLLPDGNYMFEIAEKEDTYSKAGDVMINITLHCVEPEHSAAKVWDRILIPLPESSAHKVIGRTKRFLHAINEPFQGNFKIDTDHWIMKTVEAKISSEVYGNKPKNVVVGYLLQEGNSTKNQTKPVNKVSTAPKNDAMPWDNVPDNKAVDDGSMDFDDDDDD